MQQEASGHRGERREQILDAAESSLISLGLDRCTVADVAKAAGVAKGTIYLYFTSKADMLAALRAHYLERLASALHAPGDDVDARLTSFLRGLFEFSLANHALHHLLFHEAGFREADAFAGIRDTLAGVIADGIAAGDYAIGDHQLAAAFVLHGAHGVLVDALHDDAGDLDGCVDAALRLTRAALQRRTPSPHPPDGQPPSR